MSDTRPALADVLRALTGAPLRLSYRVGVEMEHPAHITFTAERVECCGLWGPGPPVEWVTDRHAFLPIEEHRDPVTGEVFSARAMTPTEAMELLRDHDPPLWPWEAHGEGAAWWWRGDPIRVGDFVALGDEPGTVARAADPSRAVGLVTTPVLGGSVTVQTSGTVGLYQRRGHDIERAATFASFVAAPEWSHDPPSIADLVAVASLGCERLRTIVYLCGELDHKAAVAWRVVTRRALEAHHATIGRIAGHSLSAEPRHPIAAAFSAEEDIRVNGVSPWPEEFPMDAGAAKKKWPVLRAIAETGAHLIDLTPDRVVIGVEAV